MLELRFDSTECGKCRKEPNAGGIIVKTRTDTENYYCLDCWCEIEEQFHWAGVIGILVITAKGLNATARVNALVHRLLGSQFNWLIPTERGIILQGNETFIEQPSLF
jgi:hypothetical protein